MSSIIWEIVIINQDGHYQFNATDEVITIPRSNHITKIEKQIDGSRGNYDIFSNDKVILANFIWNLNWNR